MSRVEIPLNVQEDLETLRALKRVEEQQEEILTLLKELAKDKKETT